MKKIICVLIFCVTGMDAFAQSYVSGTVSGGMAWMGMKLDGSYEDTDMAAIAFNLNIVSYLGIQVSLSEQAVFDIKEGLLNLPSFGLGYAYDMGYLTIDGSIMFMPFMLLMDAAVGGRVGCTYWFSEDEDIGVTFRGDFYKFAISEVYVFAVSLGISTRVGWE
jgi:hypothetical protein